MRKPDWSTAPSWANYLAMDAYGAWYWFEAEPQMEEVGWRIDCGRYCRACHDDWGDSLEERPKEKT
jgi:hypothetical protein